VLISGSGIMKLFYTAKNYSGEIKSGEAEVKSESELALELRSEGYVLTSSKELKSEDKNKIKVKFLDRIFGLSIKDRLMFTRNLSVMVASGLPLTRAIKNLASQTKNKRFSDILNNIFNDIQTGLTFADGLSKYPGIFNELFVNMVRVGETSGNLEEVLKILADQLEKEHELMSKVKGALTYPAVIVVAMFGIGIIMLTYVLPKLTGIFTEMKVDLPKSTQFVIWLSDALRQHSFLFIAAFLVCAVSIKIFYGTVPGKKTFSFLAINTPLINNIVIKINCARFSRIYSSLLRSGVPVVESLRIVSRTLTNYYYKRTIEDSIEQVQKGVNLSKVIAKNTRAFPVLVSQMIEVGEETGKTEEILMKLAQFYEDEVTQISKNLSSIIEPILMIVIGSAVGFFAISMMQPMYSIMDNIK
jgi:type IV pilus assembly protein PilC